MKKKNSGWSFLPRLMVLTLLKEGYLSLVHFYGLLVHPFKTIVDILKGPDWSQVILVFGLPLWGGLGVLVSLGFLGMVLFFWPTNELLVNLLFLLIGLGLSLVAISGSYLAYWLVWYRRTRG